MVPKSHAKVASGKAKKIKSTASSRSSSGSTSPYAPAARILNQVWNHGKGLKSIVYDKDTGQLICSKQTYAQVCEVLKHKSLLDRVWKQALKETKQQEQDSCSQNSNKKDKVEKGTKTGETSSTTTMEIKNEGLLFVLLFELLLGPHQSIQGGGALKRHLMRLEPVLQNAVTAETTDTKFPRTGSSVVEFPRYVRINTLWPGTTWNEISTHFVLEGSSSFSDDTNNAATRDESAADASAPAGGVYRDAHIPDLLVFTDSFAPSCKTNNKNSRMTTQWLRQNTYLSPHRIVLQDKSSCFSAFCLVQGFAPQSLAPERRVYLDACAAPGNKTSHLAALVHQQQEQHQKQVSKRKGREHKGNKDKPAIIYALDRSKERCDTLRRRIAEMVPTSASDPALVDKNHPRVEVKCQDFLQTPAKDTDKNLANVTDILLDPSCSGSGIFNSLDRKQDPQNNNEDDQVTPTSEHGELDPSSGNTNSKTAKRLQSLSSFQLQALRRAMTAFPAVERIVYSTCSIHVQENEGVVAKALELDRDDAPHDGGHKWELIAPKCMQTWPCRGKSYKGLTAAESACLLRVDGPEYETNGFFAACFQKKTKIRPKSNSDAGQDNLTGKGASFTSGYPLPVYPGRAQLDMSSRHGSQPPKDEPKQKPLALPSSKSTPSEASGGQSKKSDAISKKMAKKLEWKRRQRQAKEERLGKKARTH